MRLPAIQSWWERLVGDRRGVSAVEFALISPVLCLIMGASIDLGGVLITKHKLDAAVAAGISYAQVKGSTLDATTASAIATSVANVVQSSQGTASANAVVVVNNAQTATATSGSVSTTGTASNAGVCYCPSGTPEAFTWGSPATCGSTCPGTNHGAAGKFVTIRATRTYTPLLPTFGLVQNPIAAHAAVQVQ